MIVFIPSQTEGLKKCSRNLIILIFLIFEDEADFIFPGTKILFKRPAAK